MGFAMIVLRVVTLGPALLTSLVLTVVVCALLPPTLGLVMFLAAGGLLVALALGPPAGAGDRGVHWGAVDDGGRIACDGPGAERAGRPRRSRQCALRAPGAAINCSTLAVAISPGWRIVDPESGRRASAAPAT